MTDEKINKLKEELQLLTIEDVMKLTGWGQTTVIALMSEKDFPTLKIGKRNQVTFDALKQYLDNGKIKRGN